MAGFVVGAVYIAVLGEGTPSDARSYFLASGPDIYAGSELHVPDEYLYSPAFAQLLEPLRWLGWEAFRTVWRLAELGTLMLLAGPWTAPLLLTSPVASEINGGNVHLLMAVAIVAGFRWPATWAFLILTKVTPGIGLLWFAVRREWRSLAIALGATIAIVLGSFLVAPSLWFDWLAFLVRQSSMPMRTTWEFVVLPLPLRVLAAAGLVAWGARGNHRWTVVVAAYLAAPATYLPGLAMLVGVIPLLRYVAAPRPKPEPEPTAA
jgi:hypothetical protein